MKRMACSLLLAACLAAILFLPAAADEARAAVQADEYGVNIPFTPSTRTGRYVFALYEGAAADPQALLAREELTVQSARTVFLPAPISLAEPKTYTLTVTALPMPGREGLDREATKSAALQTARVCGHPDDTGAFLMGNGSAQNPYQVASPAQLAHLQKHTGSHYKQACDIDMAGVSWQNFDFNGTYDGDGYVIRNLTSTSSGKPAGLFATFSGALMNLGIENANIAMTGGSWHAGTLAGQARDATISRCYSKDCTVSTTAGYDAGGILGNDSTNIVIEDCYALGGVYSGVRHAAGISGDFNGDSTANTIRRCYAIPAKLSGAQGNGMIAGLWGKAKMGNCYFPNDTACGSTTATASGNVAGASGLPLASFTNAASFSGWDIGGSGSAWVMGENGPELKVFAQRRAGG